MTPDPIKVMLESNGDYWRACWRTPDGRRVRRGLGAKADISRAQARKVCRAIEHELVLDPTMLQPGSSPTLNQAFEFYLHNRPELAESTVTIYETSRDYALEYFGDIPIDRISKNRVTDYRVALHHKGLAENTVRKHLGVARSVVEDAIRHDLVNIRNPFEVVRCGRVKVDKTWRYVSIAELDTILDYCPDAPWRAMFGICRLAGLRRTEALCLLWTDIDFKRRLIHVRNVRGRRTTKSRARTVPMVPKLHDLLIGVHEQALGYSEGPTDGVSHSSVTKRARRIIELAGFEPWTKPIHTLRKNCETDWLAEFPVMDVCDWLGHQASVASEHYHQTRQETIDLVTGQKRDRIAELEAELAALKAGQDAPNSPQR